MKQNYTILLVIVSVIIFISVFLGCLCTNENFTNWARTVFPRKSSLDVLRPEHPKWYKDIPEDNPEVLSLVKQTEEQSRRVKKFTKDG